MVQAFATVMLYTTTAGYWKETHYAHRIGLKKPAGQQVDEKLRKSHG